MGGSFPAVGLGTWNNQDEQCSRSVKYALEYGYRHVDTAQAYDNEEAVGEGIARADVERENIFLGTKVKRSHLSYDFVLASVSESLDRLRTDYLDILYVHWPIEKYDVQETFGAFEELYDQGVIRNVGVSNFTRDLIKEARDFLDVPITAAQFEMHPLYQNPKLLSYLEERDILYLAYSPLAHGFVPWVQKLRQIAEKYDATAAQVSIAWLLEKENVATMAMGDTPRFIRENYDAQDLELSTADLREIDDIERDEKMVDPFFAPW